MSNRIVVIICPKCVNVGPTCSALGVAERSSKGASKL